jgi:hypothetical protein
MPTTQPPGGCETGRCERLVVGEVVSGQSYDEQLAAQPASTVLITAGLGADCMRILADESSWNGEACSLRSQQLNELVSARPGCSGRLTQAPSKLVRSGSQDGPGKLG